MSEPRVATERLSVAARTALSAGGAEAALICLDLALDLLDSRERASALLAAIRKACSTTAAGNDWIEAQLELAAEADRVTGGTA